MEPRRTSLVQIERAQLLVAAAAAGPTRDFYARLGGTHLGHSTLVFEPTQEGDPFHHFALLVPGDRFAASRTWIERHVDLLPVPGPTSPVLDFPAWDAQALYFLDPAGNIVELIAHGGLYENGATGPFDPAELIGLSELGLVTPGLKQAAATLDAGLGLPLWSGNVDDDATGLGFVGRQAHTLILAAPGRGWLPTGRPAEPYPVEVTLTGTPRTGEAILAGQIRVSGTATGT